MSKKSRPRVQRRKAERELAKLREARTRLFELELGGAPEHPLPIASAAVVESHAESLRCPSCDGKHEVLEHRAVTVALARLREARLRCRQCGTQRSVWFRIQEALPN
jgi:hypothetical protein